MTLIKRMVYMPLVLVLTVISLVFLGLSALLDIISVALYEMASWLWEHKTKLKEHHVRQN